MRGAPADARSRASTGAVHDELRADILAGTYSPGEKLKFSTLTQGYGASVAVLREALTRLCEQGLVVAEPRIGFHVIDVSVPDLRDLTATRIDIETLALRYSIERGTVDWESALVAAHHRLDRTPLMTHGDAPRVADDWEEAHEAFHAALLAGCGSPRLIAIATQLRHAAEFYRRWSQLSEPDRDVPAEHRAIREATLDRDVATATDALTCHYQHTAQIVERAISSPAPA